MKTIIISIFLFVYFFAVVKGKDIILEDVSTVVNERNGTPLLKNQSTGSEQQYSTDSSTTTDWTDPFLSSGTDLQFATDISETTDWTEATSSTAGVCDCGKHSIACYLDNEGKKMCVCDVGYSQLFDTCIDCYCGEKSLGCFFDESKEKKCLCKEGYAQDQEACRETCKYDRECLNGGICKISYGRVGFCECRADYSGDRCEINDVCDHFNDVCQRYGAVCVIKDGLPSCECPSDRKGVTGLCESKKLTLNNSEMLTAINL
nr:neurogenic locus Notch protein isoform X2 [Parasteatoda tepidariorum]